MKDPEARLLARARVAFTSFESAEDPMKRAWTSFREPFVAGRPKPAGNPQRTGFAAGADPFVTRARGAGTAVRTRAGLWRLLASNNREIGRSYLLYKSFDLARLHVEQLQSGRHTLAVEVVTGPRSGSRGWVLTADGDPVMTCSRWYESSSSGVEAAAFALAVLPSATLSDNADRSGPSGRFVRRVPRGEDADCW